MSTDNGYQFRLHVPVLPGGQHIAAVLLADVSPLAIAVWNGAMVSTAIMLRFGIVKRRRRIVIDLPVDTPPELLERIREMSKEERLEALVEWGKD